MYDGLLNTSLPEGASIIGYADDVALVVKHTLPEALEIIANDSINRCDRWLREHGLQLAAEKTEAILITDRRIFKTPEVKIRGNNIIFTNSLRYLGVQLDKRQNFKVHVEIIRDKALKTANTLAAIMPNKGGPKASTRRLINSVVHSHLLYAAPIFAYVVKYESTIVQLLKPQRITALRIISAYRTVSSSAALVLSGIPPIDLLILEREEIWQKLQALQEQEINNTSMKRIKDEARFNLIRKWQERWERDEKGRWTNKLIPNIKNWIDRGHGEMQYFMTQILTGHGNFNSYLTRLKIKENASCDDCGATDDTAEHVLFHCPKWNDIRTTLNQCIGVTLTPEILITEMLKSNRNWNKCQDTIIHIMSCRDTEPLI